MSLARDFDCYVENGLVIRYIVGAEAINRNLKREAVVAPTLPKTKCGAAGFFSVKVFAKGASAPPGREKQIPRSINLASE
jgi:hypothetical protein